jgi:hypothetical protein
VYGNGYKGKDRKDYEAGLEYEKLKYLADTLQRGQIKAGLTKF